MNSSRFLIFSLSLLFLVISIAAIAQNSSSKADTKPSPTEITQQPTSLPNSPASVPPKTKKNQPPPKALFIHKPMPSPSWGKVIEYHRDQILALSEKNRETVHEFLFQDEEGVIRTAFFHENASGEGYWEVWIWDQP